MQITLSQFEAIDSAFQEMMRLGDFETCADPRGYDNFKMAEGR